MRIAMLMLIALMACTDAPTTQPGDETVASLHAGNSQTGYAHRPVPIQPAVLVTSNGEAVAGVTVTFRVTQGNGVLQGATQVTGPDGIARVTGWSLGPAGPQTLEAVIGNALGSPVVFTATAMPTLPAVVSILSGNGVDGTVGLPVDETPSLMVTDAYGRPLPGVPVSWTVAAGGGGFRYADIVTDDEGRAGVLKWILGTSVGTNVISAKVDCSQCPAITFSANGHAGAVQVIQINQGNLQRVPPGSPVPVMPAVLIRDGYGNPVPGREVVFSVVQGGGSIEGGRAISDGDGIARLTQWIVGPGDNQLRVEVEGVSILISATGAL